MSKFRNAAAIVVIAGAGIAGGSQLTAAHANSYPTLSTTQRTEVLISAKCYREYQVTRTYFHYSSKLGGYVAYPAVKTTTTTSTHCHA
jgi:hypothetical protein